LPWIASIIENVMLPREQVTVHDNWQVAGLRGTGSCDFSVDKVFVPDIPARR
jgi:hypothetical protein